MDLQVVAVGVTVKFASANEAVHDDAGPWRAGGGLGLDPR